MFMPAWLAPVFQALQVPRRSFVLVFGVLQAGDHRRGGLAVELYRK